MIDWKANFTARIACCFPSSWSIQKHVYEIYIIDALIMIFIPMYTWDLLLLLLLLMPHHITFNLFIIYFFDFKSTLHLLQFCYKSAGLGITRTWKLKLFSTLSCSVVCKIFWQFNFDANFCVSVMLTLFSLKCIIFFTISITLLATIDTNQKSNYDAEKSCHLHRHMKMKLFAFNLRFFFAKFASL